MIDYESATFCAGYQVVKVTTSYEAGPAEVYVGMIGGEIWFQGDTKEELIAMIEEAVACLPEPVY